MVMSVPPGTARRDGRLALPVPPSSRSSAGHRPGTSSSSTEDDSRQPVRSGLAWHGSARLGPARSGSAQPGPARPSSVRLGSAQLGPARLGSARSGSARPGSVRLGSAQLGPARLGPARSGSARPSSVRLGSAQLGPARLGPARSGSARPGSVRLGSARLGPARLGPARSGSARPSSVRPGSDQLRSARPSPAHPSRARLGPARPSSAWSSRPGLARLGLAQLGLVSLGRVGPASALSNRPACPRPRRRPKAGASGRRPGTHFTNPVDETAMATRSDATGALCHRRVIGSQLPMPRRSALSLRIGVSGCAGQGLASQLALAQRHSGRPVTSFCSAGTARRSGHRLPQAGARLPWRFPAQDFDQATRQDDRRSSGHFRERCGQAVRAVHQ